MLNKVLIAAAAAAFLMVSGCATQVPPAPVEQIHETWSGFKTRFLAGYFERNPTFAVGRGRHEFDGRLPDWSEQGVAGQIAFLKSTIEEANAFAVAMPDERFERDYLVSVARRNLFWLETAESQRTNPAFYMGALSPSVYVAREYAAPDVRLRAYIAYLRNVPATATQVRANLRTPLPLSFINYGVASFGGLATYYLNDGKAAFASVADLALQSELATVSNAASESMRGLATWLESERPNATQNFALGADRYAQMLRETEMIDTPLAELTEIGRADLVRNQTALRDACRRYAPRLSIARCVDRMNADKPEGGAVEGARTQLAGLRAFVVEKDLVSIPGTEEARVAEAPPFRRQNFAYIDIPGPYERDLPSTYYIAPPDPSWSRDVQAAFVPGLPDLLFTSAHEVWPGHFLNYLHAKRSSFEIGQLFVGGAFSEGWAHYTEEMMWDAGLGDGKPEIHIGQLSNALLRNCRFISAIGMHSGTMTMEQSRRMFREECYQDEGSARQQAARGTYDPGYLNYTLGKLMIRRLREDWTATRGGRTAWKAFHDQFLSYGGPPIPMVRAQMMGGEPASIF